MYCFKHAKELLTLQIEPGIVSISTPYVHDIYMEFYGHYYDPKHPDYDEETAESELDPLMSVPPRTFIELQTYYIVYDDILPRFVMMNTRKYLNDLRIKYNLKIDEEIPHYIYVLDRKEKYLNITHIVQISVLMEHYNISNNNDEKYNNIYKLIFGTYFLAWFYILITSLHTLPIESYVCILDVLLYVLFLFVLLGNYLFVLYLYKVHQIVMNEKKKDQDKVTTFLARRHLSYSLV